MIGYVDNTEIEIKVGRNAKRILNTDGLKFDLIKGRLTWDVLIGILEHPPHVYDCGRSNTKVLKSEYSRKYNILTRISKHIVVNFLNKETELQLPDNYRLFENVPGTSGLFKLVFKIKDRDTSALCSNKSDFENKFIRAVKKAERFPNDRNKQSLLIDLMVEAKKKGYISETEGADFWQLAEDAAKKIGKIGKDQPYFQPQDPDCDFVENYDEFSDDTF